jgi:hypothetical protein
MTEHKDFLLNFQNAMLLSLVERKLLTKEQAEMVMMTMQDISAII